MLFKQNKNIGGIDKWARIILGIIIIGIGCYLKSWLLIIVGLIAFITGITNWCLLYRLFGISTCKIKTNNENKISDDKINK